MHSETVAVNTVAILALVVAFLAILAFGVLTLRMLFSQRFRLLGFGILAVGCMGTVMAIVLIWSFRSHAQMRDHVQLEISRTHELQTRLRESAHDIPAQFPLESAVQLELSNAAAEVSNDEQYFDGAQVHASGESAVPQNISVDSKPTVPQQQADGVDTTVIPSSQVVSRRPAQVLAVQPAWLSEPEEFEFEGSPAKVVSSDPAPDVTTCVEDLADRLSDECEGYMGSLTPWRVNATPELIACAIHDEHVESIGRSQKVVHKLLVFDRDFKQQAKVEIKRAKVRSRLAFAGITSGVVLSSLTGLFGIFSVTHRRRERRLSSQQQTVSE